jgi:hypothetical protein
MIFQFDREPCSGALFLHQSGAVQFIHTFHCFANTAHFFTAWLIAETEESDAAEERREATELKNEVIQSMEGGSRLR